MTRALDAGRAAPGESESAMATIRWQLPSAWIPALLLSSLLLSAGCARRGAPPAEFPPVTLGMTRAAAQRALARTPGRIADEDARMLRVVGRDQRVEEEIFLFYDGKLAAWTMRFVEPASRASFARRRGDLSRSLGKPGEETDNGLVLTARWRTPQPGGRVLLSGYVGGGMGHNPLMVRVEDASALPGLLRQMRRETAGEGAEAGAESTAR